MTKDEIMSKVAENTKMDKQTVMLVLEDFFSTIKNSMAEGHNVYIRGFGSFTNKARARKVARDINKNQPMVIEAHCIPKFKPSESFVELIKAKVSVNQVEEFTKSR